MASRAIGEIFGRAADRLEAGDWRWMNWRSTGSVGDDGHDLFLAICRAAAELDMREHARAAIDLMQGQLGARLTVWNDRPGRMHTEVVTALRQAAAWYANPAEDDPAVLPMALGNLAAPAFELAPPFLSKEAHDGSAVASAGATLHAAAAGRAPEDVARDARAHAA